MYGGFENFVCGNTRNGNPGSCGESVYVFGTYGVALVVLQRSIRIEMFSRHDVSPRIENGDKALRTKK